MKIEQWVLNHKITRWLTSNVILASFYGVFLFLYEISFLKEIISIIHPILIVWAGLLTIYNVLIRKFFKRIFEWRILVIFGVLAGVTSIFNWKLGIIFNIKAWILTVLPLCVFYPACLTNSKSENNKALLEVMLGVSIIVFIASIEALYMYITRISKVISFMGKDILVGFRYYIPDDPSSGILLYGIYRDTNHAAIYAIVIAVYSLLMFYYCKKGIFGNSWKNRMGCIFAIVNFVVQLCYFPLANSRGGWLCLIVAVIVILTLYIYTRKFEKISKILKFIIAILISLICAGMLCGILLGVRSILSTISIRAVSSGRGDVNIQNESSSTFYAEENSLGIDSTEKEDITAQEPTQDIFKKHDDGFGAGRILIWEEALGIFLKRPILGTSPGNAQYYAEQYDMGEKIRNGSALHNSYLDLLVDYGSIGFLVLMLFWLLCLGKVLKSIWDDRLKLEVDFYYITFAVLFIAGAAMFLSCVYITTTAVYFMMLTMTGYLVNEDSR